MAVVPLMMIMVMIMYSDNMQTQNFSICIRMTKDVGRKVLDKEIVYVSFNDAFH
jgi:hypothetical protein